MRSEKEDFKKLSASKYISGLKKTCFLLTAFPESLQYFCYNSFHTVFELLIYHLTFSRVHGLLKGKTFFQLKEKKMCNEIFIFLLFVQFVLTNSEEIVYG